MKEAGIYRWYNHIARKSYVGSSIDLEQRKKQHLYLLSRGRSHSPKLQAVWNKYGQAAFKWEILERCSPEMLIVCESKWVRALDSVKNGYNCSYDVASPTRGHTHTLATRINMILAQERPRSKAQLEAARTNLLEYNKGLRGVAKSEAHKHRIAKALTSKTLSEETRAKIGARVITEETRAKFRGRVASEASRRKMSESRRGKTGALSNRSRPVFQCSLSGSVLARYAGAAEAARALSIGRTSIKNCLNGYSKQAGGFLWKFA